MARKKAEELKTDYQNIFAKTAAQPEPEPEEKPKKNHPWGVKLTWEEKEKLREIAAELGVKPHALLQYAARQFLADWKKGKRPKLISKGITLEVNK